MNSKIKEKIKKWLPIFICIIFFVAYSTLTLIKHSHFLTGYDQAVYEQTVWKYSQFKIPLSTIHAYYDTPTYFDHFEPILLLIAPLYWIFKFNWLLLLVQVLAVVTAAYFVFLLSIHKKNIYPIAISILIVFLTFYGIQNAIWADFHSLTLAIPFLAMFIYLMEKEKYKYAIIPFILAIICKEDIALFTLIISGMLFVINKRKVYLYFAAASIIYLLFVFGLFFPHFTPGYRFQNGGGILTHINLSNIYNTQDKRDAILYSLASFGFIPLLAPIYLLLYIADLAHYFVLGSDYVSSAQGLFLHYRGPLALFLAWPTIVAVSKFKKINIWPVAIYFLFCALAVQYLLHLPLSYLTKSWFWEKPAAVEDVKIAIDKIPHDTSIATQVNLTAQLADTNLIYTLWPTQKNPAKNEKCEDGSCNWFRIGKPVKYILVDTSSSWDARHFLEDREEFIKAVNNLEKAKVVKPVFKKNNTTLYEVTGKI